MSTESKARLDAVDKRLAELFDKQERNEITDDEVFEQQTLLDEFEVLADEHSVEPPE